MTRAELEVAEAEVRNEQRKLVAAVQAAAVKVLAVDAQRTLRGTELATTREVAKFTRKRVETAEASATDAAQAGLEVRLLETELLQLSVERAARLGELHQVLGLKPGDELTLSGGLPAPRGAPAAGVAVESPAGSGSRSG